MEGSRCMVLSQQERSNLLFKALRGNDLTLLRWLLQEHSYDVNVPNKAGYLPLNVAIEEHFLEAVQFLLELGADVNRADRFSVCPLETCIRKTYNGNRCRFLSVLFSYGVEINENRWDKSGSRKRAWQTTDAPEPSPLKYLAFRGDLESLKLLIDAGSRLKYEPGYLSPFEYAVIQNNTEEVWKILEERQKINKDESLHLAVTYADCDIVSLICRQRSSLMNAYDYQGYTPVHVAMRKNNRKALKILAQSGADLTLPTKPRTIGNNIGQLIGWSAIQKAVLSDDRESVQILLDNGVNVDVIRVDRLPLICHCLGWKQTRIAELLIRSGCQLDMTAFYKIRSHQQWSLLPLIYRCGYRSQVLAIVRHMPIGLREQLGLSEWIHEVLTKPVGLRELCRDVIRLRVRKPLVVNVKWVGLPPCLQRFVLMDSE